VVTDWGEVDGFVLRPGDQLVLGGGRAALAMLVPKGFGNPMLGRITPRGLVAEPGRVPASRSRWRVLGGVQAVERSLERGAALAGGRWAVVVRVEGGGTSRLRLSDLSGDGRAPAEVDAILRRAMVAARQDRVDVHVGIAADLSAAEQLADAAGPNQVRIQLSAAAGTGRRAAAPLDHPGRVIVGPWGGSAATAPAREVARSQQLTLFDAGRRSG
jgi:hypothetical protein